MNKEQDYASDGDESDEDFCILNENEDESGEDDEDFSESESESDDEDGAANKKSNKSSKGKKTDKVNEMLKEARCETFTRSTRQTEQKNNGRATAERDELESDGEADKSRSDALWADFLGDVGSSTIPASKIKETPLPVKETEDVKPIASTGKQKINEVLDFAGEEVSDTKTVPCSDSIPKSSVKENLEHKPISTRVIGAPKRTAKNSGGLGILLNQIGKKKKVSVLEKSQMDWKSFKSEQGIDEDLRTHNKGKNGFLERQDFLQRTDLRQFEIEKNMRQTRRQN